MFIRENMLITKTQISYGSLIPTSSIMASFLQYLNKQKWKSLEGSTLKRLYNKDILDALIALPKPHEQACIGALFAKLDSLITLHQRELDILKNLKQALLEKMFV